MEMADCMLHSRNMKLNFEEGAKSTFPHRGRSGCLCGIYHQPHTYSCIFWYDSL
uniref:Uncharacterized protein n=1 Tax=Picea glauca TaxID=3330 RepID=A0A117NJ90_PICGL|nr:hypothetical protein ABT39_MTgene959 [Picea glauca]